MMMLKRKLIVGKYVCKRLRLIKDFSRCHGCLLYLPNNAGCHNISIKSSGKLRTAYSICRFFKTRIYRYRVIEIKN